MPSAMGTFLFKIIVGSVEPRAMVTMKSNAFIFESVRLPVILRINITATYTITVRIAIWKTLNQESKRKIFITDKFERKINI